MNRFHKYDKNRDSCYHFLNTPDLYITPDIMEEVFLSIGYPSNQEERDVMEFIKQTEILKMQYCLGEITLAEEREQCLELDDRFCKEHSFWAYASDYYKRFYAAMGCNE